MQGLALQRLTQLLFEQISLRSLLDRNRVFRMMAVGFK